MPLVRDRLADQVHGALRDRILRRELRPGQRLSVPVLAAEFETSRSPVREAVLRLVQEGLAVERPNYGAVVAAGDLRALADLNQVRAPLDGLAAQLLTARCDPTLLAAIREAITLHAAAFAQGDVPGIIQADLEFHSLIARNCGNPELTTVLEPIHRRVGLAILAGEPAVWPRAALTEHQEIVAAIESGDPERARAAAEGHVLAARSRILGKLEMEAG